MNRVRALLLTACVSEGPKSKKQLVGRSPPAESLIQKWALCFLNSFSEKSLGVSRSSLSPRPHQQVYMHSNLSQSTFASQSALKGFHWNRFTITSLLSTYSSTLYWNGFMLSKTDLFFFFFFEVTVNRFRITINKCTGCISTKYWDIESVIC